jgi:hypothetical protein
MTDAAVNVSRDAGGKSQVQKDCPVIRGHGRRKGEPHAEAARDNSPPPSRAERRHSYDAGCGQQSAAVDGRKTVEKRSGSETPSYDHKYRHRERRTGPTVKVLHGTTSRPAETAI